MAGMNMEGADMRARICRERTLLATNLRYADFRGTVIHGTNFQNASLYGAKMQGVEARDADFRGADMRQVISAGRILEGAVMPAIDAQRAAFQKMLSQEVKATQEPDMIQPTKEGEGLGR